MTMGSMRALGRRALPLLALLLAGAEASAGSHDVAILYPGAPGTAAQAEETLSLLATYVGRRAGWPDGAARATFEPEAEGCRARIARDEETYAIAAPAIYCALVAAGRDVRPLAEVVRDGGSRMAFHVVGRAGGPLALSDLAGRRLRSKHLADGAFVERCLLGGALSLDALDAASVERPLRAVRDLVDGRIDAVLLDDQEFAALPGVPGAEGLVEIYRSPPVPVGIVLAIGGPGRLPDADRVAAVFLGMRDDADGRACIAALRIEGFVAPDTADLAALVTAYQGR